MNGRVKRPGVLAPLRFAFWGVPQDFARPEGPLPNFPNPLGKAGGEEGPRTRVSGVVTKPLDLSPIISFLKGLIPLEKCPKCLRPFPNRGLPPNPFFRGI